MRELILVAIIAGCTDPSEAQKLDRTGTVEGPLTTSLSGDAWLFLYKPGEGPPGAPAIPQSVSAVSAQQLDAEHRYVIANVRPNPYRLFGILDVDGDFDATIDVLSQASAGDRISKKGIDFQSQPGRGAHVPFEIDDPVFVDPPAFSFEGEADNDVKLDPSLDAVTPLTLISNDLGRYDPKKIAFVFGLVDANGDDRPDDLDGDFVPDLSIQLFLRWIPKAGQLPPDATVIVPLAFDPSPFLRTLENRLDTTVTTQRLQVLMVPNAQLLDPHGEPDGGASVTPFGPPPAGDYELVVLQAGGQFWRVPNQLGATVPSQATRLHIDRVIR
ncbi:MAG: hypothetical protein JNM17_22415 [Archangium sp.]|nr:hypothetical protein [Archangium sp.]